MIRFYLIDVIKRTISMVFSHFDILLIDTGNREVHAEGFLAPEESESASRMVYGR
jgi:hypothetical protein